MPRIRSIKPQFWIDEDLGKIPRDARLLYIGLWNLSDDTGVFEWRPTRIKAQLFPYDKDVDGELIDKWLELLEHNTDIIKFNSNGNSFGYIPSFLKHQDIKKPSKWFFAKVPNEILITYPPIPYLTPSNGELDGVETPSSHSKEKEKIKGKVLSIKEKESKYLKLFKKYEDELKTQFPEINVVEQINLCATWWAESRKVLKRPKTAVTNWMIKSRRFRENDKEREQKPKKSKYGDGW